MGRNIRLSSLVAAFFRERLFVGVEEESVEMEELALTEVLACTSELMLDKNEQYLPQSVPPRFEEHGHSGSRRIWFCSRADLAWLAYASDIPRHPGMPFSARSSVCA